VTLALICQKNVRNSDASPVRSSVEIQYYYDIISLSLDCPLQLTWELS